ncbi:MAG: sortase A [Phenylobacterium sp.]|jgi:sortase A
MMLIAKRSPFSPTALLVASLFVLSLWQLGSGAYIFAKARAAQWLLSDAWQQTLAGNQAVKPWSWADTWPVSRLIVPGQDLELVILEGSSGRTLAFGPGHVTSTPLPGELGNIVIGGHRDTHFNFLQHLIIGDILILETPQNKQIHYRVTGLRVVDYQDTGALSQDNSALTLITCYPFDTVVVGGPLRYVVEAVPISAIL